MKVTHVLYLSEKNGQSPFSGAENHVTALVRELARRGADVELLVLLWNAGPQIDNRLEELRRAGVLVTTIARDQKHIWKGKLWRAIECWFRLYLLLRERTDRIVHAHLDLIATAFVARLAGCRTVYSIHNDEPCYQNRLWRLWLRVIDRWVVAYIAITEHVRRYYIAQSGIEKRKIVTITYGVAPVFTAARRADYAIPDDRFVVGFIGRLVRQKNVEALIEAVADMPEVCCVIVGDGELRCDLKRLAKSKRATNVKFIGAVPNAAAMLPVFDVLCLPSRWEGLGLVLMEAMLQRVPIVASRVGGIPEVLGHGRYGILYDGADVHALRRSIHFAMANPNRMRRMAAEAHIHASAHLTVEQMARRTEQFYEQVMLWKNDDRFVYST